MCDCAPAVCLGLADDRSGHQVPWIQSYRCCESPCRPWDWKSSLCCLHWPCLQPGLSPTTLALGQDFSLNQELIDSAGLAGPVISKITLVHSQSFQIYRNPSKSTVPRFFFIWMPGTWPWIFTLFQQALYWLNSLPGPSEPKVASTLLQFEHLGDRDRRIKHLRSAWPT